MALPVYFLSPNMFGWCAGENGALITPTETKPKELLIFDDRNALPKDCGRLVNELHEAVEKAGAKTLLLDLERPPSPAAEQLIEAMAKIVPTVAPENYGQGSGFTSLVTYDPGKELFEEFQSRIKPGSWLELRPVDRYIRYPAEKAEIGIDTDEYSAQLQCRYCIKASEDGYILRLYDTPRTFQERFTLLSPRFAAAVGLKHELDGIKFTILKICKLC